MSDDATLRRTALIVESVLLLGFFVFYLASFRLSSAVNGPYEVFAQDSVYILRYLERGKRFRWNPQSHLLYHWVVDHGYAAWKLLFGPGMESVYRYLKLFTALAGVAFLAAMRRLFVELGLGWPQRVVMLALSGVTLAAWFHFAAFETHALALPAFALYLVALARLARGGRRGWGDRLLLVAALLVCGWSRVDLFRFAVATLPILGLPRLRGRRLGLLGDLALVAVLGVAGNALLAMSYLGVPPSRAPLAALARGDRGELQGVLATPANLRPGPLAAVGRAITLYGIVMPVEPPAAGRGFLAPPTYEVDLQYSGQGVYPSTGLFLEPARNMAGSALSLTALAGVVAALAWGLGHSLARAARGDPFHAGLLLQAASGWLLYTWFNPLEPFLWVAEFVPLWMAMVAAVSRGRGRGLWGALAALAGIVLLHNLFAFYLPFR